ncbi:dynein heavy chain 12, axonemal [Trichonephila clavipes]|nr:dynein heavy chain 12, axonemal [Trichonephila clavipes]
MLALFQIRGKGQWYSWKDSIIPLTATNINIREIIVPTVDTVRYSYLMDLCIRHHRYEKKEKSEIHLVDTQFIAAMGLPGGARNNITPRLMRHFGVIGVNAFTSSTMNAIFSSVMNIHFKNNHFPAEALITAEAIVSATAAIYNAVTAHLLPTPAKSHYTFNLRDFARVIHGCCLIKPKSLEKKKILISLKGQLVAEERTLNPL